MIPRITSSTKVLCDKVHFIFIKITRAKNCLSLFVVLMFVWKEIGRKLSVKKGRFLLVTASCNNRARHILLRGIVARFVGRAGMDREHPLTLFQNDSSSVWVCRCSPLKNVWRELDLWRWTFITLFVTAEVVENWTLRPFGSYISRSDPFGIFSRRFCAGIY